MKPKEHKEEVTKEPKQKDTVFSTIKNYFTSKAE